MTDFITTQWGSQARPFRTYPRDELGFLLRQCRQVMADIAAATGIRTFLTGGCLLGAVRSASVIPHDFDIDLGFLVEDGGEQAVLDTARRLVEYLASRSFLIDAESNGQFKAANYDAEFPLNFEFFAAWTHAGKLSHYFGIREQPLVQALLPLGTVELEGIAFDAPHDPERFVEALYGPNWRTPDPSFRFDLTEEDWRPFEFLFTNRQQFAWDAYYRAGADNPTWVESPSQFAAYVAAHAEPGMKLLDVGCGNGHDSVFFARLGLDVSAIDYSAEALAACARLADRAGVTLDLRQMRVSAFSEVLDTAIREAASFDIVYARLFLDAVDAVAEANLLRLAHALLRPQGRLMLEYRCADPAAPDAVFRAGNRQRRQVAQPALEARAGQAGFALAYSVAGKGLAALRGEDPLVARSILVKQ